MPQKIKEKIKNILVENMLGWKATDKVSTREFNKLLKQLSELFEELKQKWVEEDKDPNNWRVLRNILHKLGLTQEKEIDEIQGFIKKMKDRRTSTKNYRK